MNTKNPAVFPVVGILFFFEFTGNHHLERFCLENGSEMASVVADMRTELNEDRIDEVSSSSSDTHPADKFATFPPLHTSMAQATLAETSFDKPQSTIAPTSDFLAPSFSFLEQVKRDFAAEPSV